VGEMMAKLEYRDMRVLVAASSPEITAKVKSALKTFGFSKIDAIDNGIEALKQLSETEYHFLICHNAVKFISGWSLIKEVKTSEKIPNMPVILMGDLPSPATEDELKQYGLVKYLKSPPSDADLSFLISSTLQLFHTSGTIENKFTKAKSALLSSNSEQAVEIYSELHSLTKKNVRSSLGLAEAYTQTGNIEKAELIVVESIKTNGSDSPAALLFQVKILIKGGKFTEATAAADQIIKPLVDTPFYHSRVLQIYNEAKRADEAEGVCTDAIVKKFKVPDFWQVLARLQYSKSRFDESLNTLSDAQQTFGPSPELMNIKGACLRKASRFPEALAAYEDALKLAPMDAKVYFNMAVCCISARDLESAFRHLETCTKIAPDFPNARAKLEEIQKHLANKAA
jgi:Flp pilus assembly protein TadD